jgi:hypothetical protein
MLVLPVLQPAFGQQFGPPPGEQSQFGPPPGQQPQFGPPPGQQSQFGPPPGQAAAPPMQPMMAPQQQQPPCLAPFTALRDDTARKADAVRKGQARKAPIKEACTLLTAFAAAEAKLLKYATDNATGCGIPPQIVKQIATGHAQASQVRTRVCDMAAAPPRARGPTLSDVLGRSSVPDASNVKPGRGTFDTLTGTPLGNSEK